MSNNPWDFDDPVHRMMREMEQIRHMTDPYSDVLRQAQREYDWMERTDAVGVLNQQFEDRLELHRQLDQGQEILRELRERREMLHEIEEKREILRQLEERQEVQRQLTEAALNLSSAYGDALREAAAVGDIFLRHRGLIDGYVFGTFYGGSTSSIGPSTGSTAFRRANEELAESYEEVSESLEPEEETSVPPSARSMPTIEAFASAEVVEELAAAEQEKVEKEPEENVEDRENRRKLGKELQEEGRHQLQPSLEALEPRLVKIWEGGSLALSSANPDRVRHFCASRRELITHVLHLLAPDEEIRKWNTNPNLYHDGRPTRMARLQYICRSIYQDSFRGFVNIDFRLMLETLDVFQKGTHALEMDFTLEQLNALSTRADQHLLFLLLLGDRRN